MADFEITAIHATVVIAGEPIGSRQSLRRRHACIAFSQGLPAISCSLVPWFCRNRTFDVPKAEEFLARAAECERRAKAATDSTARRDFENLADQWRYLARLAEQRDG